jgi:hypothetical protein
MGVTAWFYAATADIDRVEAALRSTYREDLGGVIAEERPEAGMGALEQIYKNDDGTLVVLWRDGAYTCWAESEACLADEAELCAVSAQLGTVLLAMIGDHGGSYAFALFRDGDVVRWLQNDCDLIGSPITEEAGIDPATLSDLDVETIWERFGLKPYYDGVPPFRALRAASHARPNIDAPPPASRSKSRWKFW